MKKYALVFVVLILWTTPSYGYGIERVENKASNSKHKAEEKSINNEPNKHKEDRNDIQQDEAKEDSIRKTQELQYTQLLEVHRTYFTVFLQVVSIYLAVIGGCISIVDINIRNLKGNRGKDGSKTILFVLIAFALVLSSLFWLGLDSGKDDAIKRSGQIIEVAKQLNNITPVNVNLLENLIEVLRYGVQAIIILWIFVIVRGLMFVEKIKNLSILCPLMWCGAGLIATLWLVSLIYRLSGD